MNRKFYYRPVKIRLEMRGIIVRAVHIFTRTREDINHRCNLYKRVHFLIKVNLRKLSAEDTQERGRRGRRRGRGVADARAPRLRAAWSQHAIRPLTCWHAAVRKHYCRFGRFQNAPRRPRDWRYDDEAHVQSYARRSITRVSKLRTFSLRPHCKSVSINPLRIKTTNEIDNN